MDNESVKDYQSYKKQAEYPNIKDLYCVGTKVNKQQIIKQVKNLQDNTEENISWVKYEVTLIDYIRRKSLIGRIGRPSNNSIY